MNNNDKNSKVSDDNKNCKVPVSQKAVIQHSTHLRNDPYTSDATDGLRVCNRADEKIDLDVSRAITKRLSCTLKKKSPQIHECGKKIHTDKFCRAHLVNATSKIEGSPRNQIKREKKYSKVVVSDEKSTVSASRKAQPAFKTNEDTVINRSRNISKKTSYITNRNRSLPKAKEVPCSANRRDYKEKDCNWKREESSRSTAKKLEEVNPKQANHCIRKKYSESVNVKDEIKSYNKQSNNIADNLDKTKETEIIDARQISKVKQTVHKKIVSNDTDANVERNGAARTRIFQCMKRSQVDKNLTKCKDSTQEREEEHSKNEFQTKNPPPVEKQNQVEQENKPSDSTKHNCEQGSINSCCNIKDDKIIDLYDGWIATPESTTDCDQYQEFGETFVKAAEERGNNSCSFVTSSKTSCKQTSSGNTQIDLSERNINRFSGATGVSWDQNLSKQDKNPAITDSIKILGHDYNETEKSLTNSKVPSISQDEITYHTNLMNYGYHSSQQYCKRSSKKNKWNTADAAIRLTGADKNQSTVTDDAKYNLMKALIQPATKIHDFKSTGNNIRKLLSARESERVLTCGNEGLQNCYINSSSNGSINEESLNVSSSVKQLEDNTSNLAGCAVWNQHSNPIYRKQPLRNSSNYIGLNSKLKSCKYTKKYRHFKHEDKNMRCNMARYIKRMVSKERKYQEFEKRENLERKEVKIIIDQNSAKTSKIRIVNDRSNLSVICHSLERTLSPSKRRHNDPASKTESSGGESSGYKSFHDNSDTKNVDLSDQNETQHSAIIMTHDHGKRNPEMKYSSNDAKDYLSTFTNCMDIYLPCEITAYQFEKRNKGQTLQFTNTEEHVDTNIDNDELHVGKYLDERNSDTTDESSEGEESSERLDSVKDFTTAGDEVIMLKKPDDPKYESIEFVVDERFLEPDIPGLRINSTDIPTVPAQYRIVTSVLDLRPEEITESSESSETPMNASQVKFTIENNRSAAIVKFSNVDIERDLSNITFPPTPQVRTNKDIFKKSGSHGTTCSGRLKNKSNRSAYSNAVHELWTNKKSTVDSTDNESQSSGRTGCGKSCLKKHDTNKFKFNIFRKLKSSASEKTIGIPLNQLPNSPPPFLHTSASLQSTTFSSTANTDASESKIVTKPHAFTAPILRTNSFTIPLPDTARVHYARNTHRDTVSNETINDSQFDTDESDSIVYKDAETDPESSIALPLGKRFISQESHPAVPPPASALPPPYPFCCPLVPYMMQYWQNNQQPPPPSTVPLPEADWKPTVSAGSAPPPPGMIPIPWFPPILDMNNPPPSGGMNPNMSNTLHLQPPPDWQMKPRGYAPCLPCSKTPELPHLRRTDSPIHEEDEPALDISENRQDGRKKKVSDKLFKIFRRKNRADIDTVDEDDKKSKGRYLQSRSATRSNNVPVEQNDQQNLDDHSIWESPDIAGIVTPEDIGRCFRRGFRPDGLTLSGDDYLCTKAPSDTTSEQEDTFNFSDHDTPLDFLLGLGFSVDEATAAIRDDEVRSRFKAALTEARIWVPHIATTQGTLLYLLAMKAKQKVMRYFLQLVEAIVNKRITNAVKLDAYLKILEMVEEGYVSFVTLFGKDTGKDDEEDTVIVEKQRRRILYTIYKYAESEAKEVNRPLTRASVDLLHSLAARYRSAIGPHLQLLACYIGEGLLTKDVQLEAAVIYLSRLDSTYVQLADLEKYCGLPPSERRRADQAAKTQS